VNKLVSTTLIALILFVYSNRTIAQEATWSGPLSFGISTGAAIYKGDLSDHNANPWLPFSKDANFSVAGFFAKELGPLNLRFQMNLGGLKGYDFRDNERFSNNFYEYNAIVSLNLNHLIKLSSYRDQGYNVYLLGGYGMMRYSSYLTELDGAQIPGGDIGYAGIERANTIIAGAGVKINIIDKLNFLGEFTTHIANSDLLDTRVENDDNDSYYYFSLGLSYDILGSSSGGSSRHRKSLRWGRF
jgi:hypothetical protein